MKVLVWIAHFIRFSLVENETAAEYPCEVFFLTDSRPGINLWYAEVKEMIICEIENSGKLKRNW
jgi:hypothetical protein